MGDALAWQMSPRELMDSSLWEWGAMIHDWNRRQPKPNASGSAMQDDGAAPPTPDQTAAWKEHLQQMMPDVEVI